MSSPLLESEAKSEAKSEARSEARSEAWIVWRELGARLRARSTQVVASSVLAGLVAFYALRWWSPQHGDDTFITLRYAQRLADGEGLTWNPGERVEGFSCPLWVFLLALARIVGLDLLSAAKVSGLAMATASVVVAAVAAQRAFCRADPMTALAIGLAGCTVPLAYWTSSGMETALTTLLLTGSVVAHAWDEDPLVGRGRPIAFALSGLLALTRPEGALLVVALIGLDLLVLAPRAPWRAAETRRTFFYAYAIAALFPLAYLCFRLSYFGVPWPNTAYAKMSSGARYPNGFGYLKEYFSNAATMLLVIALGVALAGLRWRGRPTRPARLAGTASVQVLALGAAAVYMGGDWMSASRLLAPATMAMALALVCSVPLLLPRRLPVGPVVLAITIAALWHPHGMYAADWINSVKGQRMSDDNRQEGRLVDAHREIAEHLKARSGPRDVVAVNHAGAIGYYSGLPVLDMTGLNDRHIARDIEGPLHEKYDVAYVLACRPRYIVLNSREKPTAAAWYHTGYWNGETDLFDHPDFAGLYAPMERFWAWHYGGRDSYTVVYERRPSAEALPTGELARHCWQ